MSRYSKSFIMVTVRILQYLNFILQVTTLAPDLIFFSRAIYIYESILRLFSILRVYKVYGIYIDNIRCVTLHWKE